jgi:GH25 family lysozyme M1 (1,4-beta-N-acetylmuramidase)
VSGIDVSVYQGSVDWRAVKATGIGFAYIRASEQANIPDANFAANYSNAKAQGLLVGAYHRAKPDASSGKAQADYFLDRAQFANDGKTLPPVLDVEAPRAGWTSPTGRPLNACYNMSPAQLVAWMRAFLAEVTARTHRLGVVYTGTNWWNACTGSNTTFGQYPLWVARYSTSPLPLPAGWANLTFWQYSASGKLPNGTPVDQDVFRGGTAALTQLALGSGYHVLTSNGDVHSYGVPWFGSDTGKLAPGITAAAIATDPTTGGYWILKSNGGVDPFNAPWYGSLNGGLPAGQKATGVAGA